MSDAITRVEHRHSDLKKGAPDLILEVGKPLPRFYQSWRSAGRVVVSIAPSGGSLACTLDDGDVIFVGNGSVSKIMRSSPDA